mgnify:CR=1 FL=1
MNGVKKRKYILKRPKKRYYEQKVDFVIGGLDMTQHTEINRPIYGLTDNDALTISRMVNEKLFLQGFNSTTSVSNSFMHVISFPFESN